MILEIIIVAVTGLLTGGLVNMLADDLPLRRSLRWPRYVSDDKKRAIHMPDEMTKENPITLDDDEIRLPVAWLGITAFLLGKRTSPNGVKLSWRYPLTELFTMLLMLITIIALQNNEKFADVGLLQTAFWLVYMAFFALITIIDIEHKLILFVVIIPFAFIATTDAVLGEFLDYFYEPSLGESLFGGLVGFVVFFIIYNGGFLFTYLMGKLRRQEIDEVAFGYGDVMMATVSGLVLGWQSLILAILLTAFLGAFGALLYMFSRRLVGQKYSAFTAIPYGPYIVIGTIMVLLYKESVIDLLFGY